MKCRICGGSEFKKVIDFGETPLVNSLIDEKDLDKKEKTYPLLVEQCTECTLVQIVNPVPTHEIYQAQDYLYFTGDMPTTNEYFRDFAMWLSATLKPNSFVVEIGSNDGTMLKNFNGYHRVLGVDPSTNVVIRALANGIPTLSGEFNERNAINIVKEFGQADLIGGANCIAHLNDLHSLMRGIDKLLKNDGIFWVECNYWGAMVKNTNYSLIYHDHYSYFSLKNWVDLAKKYHMEVLDAYVTPAQGGSLRVFMSKEDRKKTQRFYDLLAEDINDYKSSQEYEKNCKKEAKKLKETVEKIKKEGKTIAGYGAAAKGFSVLHLAGIDGRHIDYFVDDSPAKQGKYTPVTHIPVVSREQAKTPDYFFLTAPNYEAVIVEKEKKFAEAGGKFLTCDSRII